MEPINENLFAGTGKLYGNHISNAIKYPFQKKDLRISLYYLPKIYASFTKTKMDHAKA